MGTFYLVDFENVNNEGIENIGLLSNDDSVHIFSTENALNVRMDLVMSRNLDIQAHIVPVRKQSLDMHLVSYLGYLLGVHGQECSCVIISKDTDYDNIIKFWKEEGYKNIVREPKITEKTALQSMMIQNSQNAAQDADKDLDGEQPRYFSGKDRCELNNYMQRALMSDGYDTRIVNSICKCVIAHCNDDEPLDGMQEEIKEKFKDDYAQIFEDVKRMFNQFPELKDNNEEKELEIRAFYAQHFRAKVYEDNKERIIEVILNAKSRQQLNNGLTKVLKDGVLVSNMYKTIQPFVKRLPGK